MSTGNVQVPATPLAEAAAAAEAAGARTSPTATPPPLPAPVTARELPPSPAAAPALDLPMPDTPRSGGSAGGAGSTRGRAAGLLLASRQRDLEAEQVVECDPGFILDGLSLSAQQLGRGSFGVVVSGAYHGLPCAVKVMVADSLDSSALSELLLAPTANHANLVQTYTTRCAELTHGFFDMLEGGGGGFVPDAQPRDPSLPRLLLPITNMQSGDGFGDPGRGVMGVRNPYSILHALLYEVRATVGQRLLVIVQELCAKSTLHNAIRRGTFNRTPQWGMRLARRALLRTAVEVARGLLHLHEAGIVHGDVKPQNVLLASSRDDRRGFMAKVADFGLAHVLPPAANSVRAPGGNGSPAYMAPEAFHGSVSRASDVWSFGVCLLEMLTGVRPFSDVQAVDAEALIAAIREGRVRLVWPVRAEMGEGIIAIGRRCMSPNPEDRPGFREIIEELVNTERIIRAEVLAPAIIQRVTAEIEAEAAAAADAAAGGGAGGPQQQPQPQQRGALSGLSPQQRSQRLAEALERVGIPSSSILPAAAAAAPPSP
ncbi:hypothetical protein HYH02_006109 [Chlamydomonas schloesseri]|uniref:Protein kinase domain-containing protein n=1 Tax=Chlamydomonas schloesseri TaxID=2026947 RepID=A0A835WL18_9CHLO|nr:hypothetical protein HYH02_006109 [Chlamydomonas schloesseri]|eukprot:KAG2448755.1 hypothetical protein HYH02_006109 [Chlamydomonas schloesseri]